MVVCVMIKSFVIFTRAYLQVVAFDFTDSMKSQSQSIIVCKVPRAESHFANVFAHPAILLWHFCWNSIELVVRGMR